ncbi:MAG TPA: DOMON-like domain-containing protein [Candidatus Ozemobacteraceae bacterium]|nr:DOMON-like domain-containing protein [Candidatus Ozemobacteraceae bacterium]HQG27156.1 DOMON-like domain-containing protein [Candidatus Ozemobacteraceae bacterium]
MTTPTRPFRLAPFPGSAGTSGISVSGTVLRQSEALAVRFEVTGNVGDIDIAPPVGAPERRDKLWEATCFEMFLGIPDSDAYLEFNLSPSHHWNAYRFDGYRKGMRNEPLLRELPFATERTSERFSLSLELEISSLVRDRHPVSIGLTAVILMRNGTTTYWALSHTGPEPDFHRRDSFSLLLPAHEGA